MNNNIIELNQEQKEIIDGLMLGDGYIGKEYGNINCRFGITQKRDSVEYLEDLSTKIQSNKIIYSYNSNQSKKIFPRVTLYTRRHKFWTEQRKVWYPNNKKIVPFDINITPTILLHWFICDGCCVYNQICSALRVKLATNCFTFNEVELLNNKLHQINIQSTIHNTKQGYTINLNNQRCHNFFKYIGECPYKCFQYKWDHYNNFKSSLKYCKCGCNKTIKKTSTSEYTEGHKKCPTCNQYIRNRIWQCKSCRKVHG